MHLRYTKHNGMSVRRNFISVLTMILLMAVMSIPVYANTAEQIRAGTVSTRADFTRALGDRQSVIYVDDIDFGENGGRIEITNDVVIIGEEGGTVFSGVYFDILGSELESELITVRFENIIFDGGYDTASIVFPEDGEGFNEIFGDRRAEYRCINCSGFVDLSFFNCDFTRYVAFAGSVMNLHYTDGNEDLQKRGVLRMDNCNVYDNISIKGTIWVNGENTKGRFINCRFYENTARGAAGLFLGGMDVEVIDCEIENNRYYSYFPKEEDNRLYACYGGGLFAVDCNLRLTGTRIENNRADLGGGIYINDSDVWIENCRITDNSAVFDGGGVFISSSETLPTYITNTLIAANKAERGGAFFVTLSDAREFKIPAGIIECSFSTIGCNEAKDGTHFWYDDSTTIDGKRGKIDLLGCFILDDSIPAQAAKAPDYTYVVSVADAVSLNAAPREQINFPQHMGLRPMPGGVADVTVPIEAVKLWAKGVYAAIGTGRTIGWNGTINNGKLQKTNSELDGVNPFLLIISAAVILCVIGAIFIYFAYRKKRLLAVAKQEKAENETDGEVSAEIPEYVIERLETFIENIETLSIAERRVFDCYMQGFTPKEAENQLYLAKSTIQGHNKKIYAKLNVDDYKEMMLFIKLMKGCSK